MLQELLGANTDPVRKDSMEMKGADVNILSYLSQIWVRSEVVTQVSDCSFDPIVVVDVRHRN
jgi:hypothetical protein